MSPRLLQFLGYDNKPQPDSEIGLSYIHGVEPAEKPLHRPLQNFEGYLAGRYHAVGQGRGARPSDHPGDPPRRRGDRDRSKEQPPAQAVVERACADYREPDTFIEFHPAFPERGVRLDFTFNWQKPTEIASRIQSIMPPDTAGAFPFGWDAVNVVVRAGRNRGTAQPDEAHQIHRGRHRTGARSLTAPLLRPSAVRRLARSPGYEETAARCPSRQHETAVGSGQRRSDGFRRLL